MRQPTHSGTLNEEDLLDLPRGSVRVDHGWFSGWVPTLGHDQAGRMILQSVARQPLSFEYANAFELRRRFLEISDPYQAMNLVRDFGPIRPREDEGSVEGGTEQLAFDDLRKWQVATKVLLVYGPIYHPSPLMEENAAEKLHAGGEVSLPPWMVSFFNSLPRREQQLFSLTETAQEFRLISGWWSNNWEPILEFGGHSILDSVIGSVVADRIAQRRYGLCELSDCENLFEITTKLPKRYCCPAHANLASIRKKRGTEVAETESKGWLTTFKGFADPTTR